MTRKPARWRWRETDRSSVYDYKSIARRLATLREYRASGDDKALLYALNEGIHGNMDGMGAYEKHLYQEGAVRYQAPDRSLCRRNRRCALDHLARPGLVTSIGIDEKRDFFNRAQQCYGRSALMPPADRGRSCISTSA